MLLIFKAFVEREKIVSHLCSIFGTSDKCIVGAIYRRE